MKSHLMMAMAVFAMVPVLMSGMGSSPIIEAMGADSGGVCGIQLCSEIEGGREAWTAASSQGDQQQSSSAREIAMVSLPLHRGYFDGQITYYIITEASEPTHAEVITASQGWKVKYAPSLQTTPQEARSNTYMFTNGVSGSGVHGFQSEVFTSVPSMIDTYSPLTGHIHVTWTNDAVPRILDSEKSILAAAQIGEVVLTELDVVINIPRFEMTPVQADMLERMPERRLSLPLHYAYHDGKTIYGIVLESSDKTHADLITAQQGLKSTYAPALAGAVEQASSKVYFFTNGFEGFGTHSYQRQVFSADLGHDDYSPITAHVHATWMADSEPRILKSEDDILAAKNAGDLILAEIPIAINMPIIQLGAGQVAMLPEEFNLRGDGIRDTKAVVVTASATATEKDDDMETGMQDDDDDDDNSMQETAAQDDAVMQDKDGTQQQRPDTKEESTAAAHVSEAEALPPLRLARASVAVDIPLHKGYYNGQDVHYIITDSSDPTFAEMTTQKQGWQVELAPFLKSAADDALAEAYMFTNGVSGNGAFGFQGGVFTSTPAEPSQYSSLASHVYVTWTDGSDPRTLDSEAAILKAADAGEVSLNRTDIVVNMPQIIWPKGQMPVRDNLTIGDDDPYGGAQILDISTDEMTVTFVAHRGWGPDGRTIYYIVTDATPSGPAKMMGVATADTAASLIANPAAVDLYQFANGIPGPGPLGFQPGIASAALGDPNYSPMWRIYVVTWNDPSEARLLETINDINVYLDEEQITVNIARPMNSDHIVNCPFVDPFQ